MLTYTPDLNLTHTSYKHQRLIWGHPVLHLYSYSGQCLIWRGHREGEIYWSRAAQISSRNFRLIVSDFVKRKTHSTVAFHAEYVVHRLKRDTLLHRKLLNGLVTVTLWMDSPTEFISVGVATVTKHTFYHYIVQYVVVFFEVLFCEIGPVSRQEHTTLASPPAHQSCDQSKTSSQLSYTYQVLRTYFIAVWQQFLCSRTRKCLQGEILS